MLSENYTLPNDEYFTIGNSKTVYRLISLSYINNREVEIVAENNGIRYFFRRNESSIKKYTMDNKESYNMPNTELEVDQLALWLSDAN